MKGPSAQGRTSRTHLARPQKTIDYRDFFDIPLAHKQMLILQRLSEQVLNAVILVTVLRSFWEKFWQIEKVNGS